jgi:hypothetical protein
MIGVVVVILYGGSGSRLLSLYSMRLNTVFVLDNLRNKVYLMKYIFGIGSLPRISSGLAVVKTSISLKASMASISPFN